MSASLMSTPSSSHNEKRKAHALVQSAKFLDDSKGATAARAIYLKIFFGGCVMILVLIFGIMSIFWGSLWKIPAHNLPGWIVDFDGEIIGKGVSQALSIPSALSKVTWMVMPASNFPGGPVEVGAAVLEERTWMAIIINEGSTSRLNQSLNSPNPTYNGSQAITVFGVEARNENAYRIILRPTVQATLDAISRGFANQVAQQAANLSNLPAILATSPQTITAPIAYELVNLAPFDIPVATAVTFVGLIYQVILSFFIVMIGQAARDSAGLTDGLETGSLISLRMISSFTAYFFLSLFYCLLSLAFQLNFSHKFGSSGFLVFWMLNYVGMLALGLALESLITLLTVKFIPFFMLTWIITNVSVCTFPIEVLPNFYRYGYAMPFYNVSRAMRTIVFGTKNRVGFSFGILVVWISVSCITLPLIQWLVRRRPQSLPTTFQDDVREGEEEEYTVATKKAVA
ncbi:hypothetical protein HYPSUDRAFT_42197 [Hypholoma sublateritium FD-334 SS-4]|uniref:DUF3533 domain-containing protein n=1 Tax=Hypholoma sublateritium (strain FD-334 SS-4) TaxID=945553 RepID=A0A0D2NXX7_HYPSF|nr:hypothetical protein HYPSUDRAFT_42197 [Hypholoma sublateritium FD-334 SS-4]